MAEAVYGSWKSPISSQLATQSSISFQDLYVDNSVKRVQVQQQQQQQQSQSPAARPHHDCTVYWSEMRPDEGGRYVICSKTGGCDITEWTPASYNARTTVHEYGGGSFQVVNETVYFSNFTDQRLYCQSCPTAEPVPITPADCGWRFADGDINSELQCFFCIREDHSVVTKGESNQPKNTVVSINLVTKEQTVLAEGYDFYASPRVSPDGSKLAWIQWKHPNMPWDSTELWTAELNAAGNGFKPTSSRMVAGAQEASVMQPRWTADNRLLYISDLSEWWNLYTVLPSGEHVNLHSASCELGGPHWTFANHAYHVDLNGEGNICTSYGGELAVVSASGEYKKLDTGYSSHSYLQYGRDGWVYCRAASPTQFSVILRVNPRSQKVEVLKKSREVDLDAGYLSVPQSITWPTSQGDISHGFLYLPKSKEFTGPPGTLPPLLVKAHGGPTGQSSSDLNMLTQYFTSRGFTILDVNYRGSTGYGKTYRHRLRHNWGVYDVDDCSSGALHLAETNRVDGDRLCIDGGSAGGYTTLACLTFKDVFKAGVSRYGIGDIEILMQDTHKFESRYCDLLIMPYVPENLPLIHARSPIKHMDRLDCAVAFFQGDEDKIVPPNQAELMFNAVKAKGLPCAYVLFKGEQHGFRKAENIQKSVDGEFYFFSKVFGFESADKTVQLEIFNM